jgi:hypothetical protein
MLLLFVRSGGEQNRPVAWWKMTRDEALALAQRHVQAEGLPWTQPVSVMRRPLGGWEVLTNRGNRGRMVSVRITRRGRIDSGLSAR